MIRRYLAPLAALALLCLARGAAAQVVNNVAVGASDANYALPAPTSAQSYSAWWCKSDTGAGIGHVQAAGIDVATLATPRQCALIRWTGAAWQKIIDSGGSVGGAVTSVNGLSGAVTLTAASVGAEATANRNASGGYAGLTAGKLAYSQIPIGTTASTVAAGDDSRFTGALRFDVAQTLTGGQGTQARANLGLGTLATQNGTFSGSSSGANTGDQTFSLGVPSIFTAGASSVSSLSFTVAAENANRFWAGPTSGASGAPAFRDIVSGDLPIGSASGTVAAGDDPRITGAVRFDTTQTLTGGQGTQARSNIGAQVAGSYQPAGSYATGTGSASGTNTGDQTFSLAVPTLFTAGANSTSALSFTLASEAINTVFAGPASGSSAAPAFRALVANDLPASGVTAGAYGSTSVVPGYTVDAKGRITGETSYTITAAAIGAQAAGSYPTGSGTVSGTNTGDQTITLSVPSIFTAGAGSTSIPSFSVATQAANLVWAGPVSGAAAVPAFRALVAADIPALPTYAPLASPGLTGTPTAPTATAGTSTTQLATTAFSAASITAAQALDLKIASNLSDLASASTARSNLGLGGAAVLSVGTTAGTVAAGDDSRITGAAQLASANTWPAKQTFTLAPGFTDAPGSRVALGIESRVATGDVDYTILVTNRLVSLNAALTAARTWTLPAASAVNAGQSVILVFGTGGSATNWLASFPLNVAPTGTDKINGSTSAVTVSVSNTIMVLYSNGSNAWSTDVRPGLALQTANNLSELTGAAAAAAARLNIGVSKLNTSVVNANTTAAIAAGNRILQTTPLTTGRTLGFLTSNANPGDMIEYRRTGSDVFLETLQDFTSSATLGTCPVNITCRVMFGGTAWVWWGSSAN